MYYSQIRVDPTNPDIAYQGGAPFFKTSDGGKTWRQVQGLAHSDHHAIWIDPRDHNHLMVGNDGGLDISYDQAETWEFVNSVGAVGQFYKISADMRKPYYVCGGLQDNGSWCGPSGVRSGNGILNSDWFRVGGGDGFYTANDPTDWRILYSESQDGDTNRVDLGRGTTVSIRPRGPAGRGGQHAAAGAEGVDPAVLAQFGFGPGAANGNIVPPPPPGTNFRFYWNTPFLLSPHNPSTIYLGAERVFKSMDRGNTWVMSPDLTRNIGRNDRPIMEVDGKAPMASKHDGAAAYSNVITISESPVVPGIVWAGTNDGNVQVSRDGGMTWKNVDRQSRRACPRRRTSRASRPRRSTPARAYVTFDGHRTDDHKPYVFVTQGLRRDLERRIAANLPMGNVNVITTDDRNPQPALPRHRVRDLRVDGCGQEWKRLMQGMPTVRIDDLIIHPRERDLIAGTHGRSIWIRRRHLGARADDRRRRRRGRRTSSTCARRRRGSTTSRSRSRSAAHKNFRGQNPDPGTAINYWLKADAEQRAHRHHGRHRPRRPHYRRSEDGGPESRALGHAARTRRRRAAAREPARPNSRRPPQPRSSRRRRIRPRPRPPGASRVPDAKIARRRRRRRRRHKVPGALVAADAARDSACAGCAGRGGGRGRGGFAGPALPAGTYLVKVTVDGKVIGTKTVVIEADSLQ